MKFIKLKKVFLKFKGSQGFSLVILNIKITFVDENLTIFFLGLGLHKTVVIFLRI